MGRRKLENKNHTELANLMLSSPSLSESSKFENGVAGHEVREISLSDGPSPMCSNVLRTRLKHVAS